MVTINKLKMPIQTARQIEDNNAKIAKQMADINYIAMMADVDLPNEEEEEINDLHND